MYLTAGKSSQSDGSDARSPPHSNVMSPPHKLQCWSSLFHGKFHRNSSQCEHSLLIHSSVSRPFKPVGHIRQFTTTDSSLCAPRTVSSECPLPCCTTPDNSVLTSPQLRPQNMSSESPLQATTGNTLVQATPGSALDMLSLESPLQATAGNALDPLQTVLSENPLPSMHNLTDDSGSEEDPTIETTHRSDSRKSTTTLLPGNNCGGVPARSRLSAAAHISMAVSKSNSLSKLQSDGDTGHRDASPQRCSMAPTTKISLAVTSQNSKIGRRLSSMLHNSRLRQQSSSSGKILTVLFFTVFGSSNDPISLLKLVVVVLLVVVGATSYQRA